MHEGDMRTFRFDTQFALSTFRFGLFAPDAASDQIVAPYIRRHCGPCKLALNFFDPSLEYIVAHSGPIVSIAHNRDTFIEPPAKLLWNATIHYAQHRNILTIFSYDRSINGRVWDVIPQPSNALYLSLGV
jgi:hypothetical protein